jgi:hypothetical protein
MPGSSNTNAKDAELKKALAAKEKELQAAQNENKGNIDKYNSVATSYENLQNQEQIGKHRK